MILLCTSPQAFAVPRWSLILVVLLITSGCFTPDTGLRERSAIEQQLLGAALDRAVAKLELPPYKTARTQVTVRGPDGIDRDLIALKVQKRLSEVRFARGPEELDTRLEVWVTVAGNDSEQDLIGVPIPIGTTPLDVGVWSRDALWGRAHLSLVLVGPTSEVSWESSKVTGTAYYGETTLLTVLGPFPATDIPDFERPRRIDED